MVKDFHPISSKKVEWQTITPNKKVDWINQRDGIFSSFIALQLEKKKDLKVQSFLVYILLVSLQIENLGLSIPH